MAEAKARDSRSRTKQVPSSSSTNNADNIDNHTQNNKIRSSSANSRRRWNSSSKFNQILNNLERTIFNQFHATSGPATSSTAASNHKIPISKPILNQDNPHHTHNKQQQKQLSANSRQTNVANETSLPSSISRQNQQQTTSNTLQQQVSLPKGNSTTTSNLPSKVSLLNQDINPIIKIDSMNHNAIKQSARQKFNSLTSAALQQQQRQQQQQAHQNLMNKGTNNNNHNNDNSQPNGSARDSYNNGIMNSRSYNYLQNLSSYSSSNINNNNISNNNNNNSKIISANNNHDRKHRQQQQIQVKNAIPNSNTTSFPDTSSHGDNIVIKSANTNNNNHRNNHNDPNSKMITLPSSLSSTSCSSSSPGSNAPSSSRSAVSATQSLAASPSTKSENNTDVVSGGKKTLNRYQQQIVSTLTRSSQNLLNSARSQTPSVSTRSSNPFLVPTTRQLSIPPPHATDEARIENHRMIFGVNSSSLLPSSAAADNKEKENNNSHIMGNVTTNHLATAACQTNRGLSAAKSHLNPENKTPSSNLIQHPHQYNGAAQHDTHTSRPNTSPTSSAISLPNLNLKQHLQGSQQSLSYSLQNNDNNNTRHHQATLPNNNIIEDDDEESGFATYQSTRLLQQANLNHNPRSTPPQIPARSIANPLTTGGLRRSLNSHQQFQQFNKQQQQRQTGQMNQQQNIYAYQNPPVATTQQQHHHHHQQQQHANSNFKTMVPAPTGHPGLRYNVPGLGVNMVPSNVDQFAQAYTYYDPSRNQPLSLGSVVDNNQQIYANAPPKPRRYQYYDSNRLNFLNIVPPSNMAYSPITVTDSSGQTIPYNQPQINQGLYIQDGQQLLQRQFMQPQLQQQQLGHPSTLVNQNTNRFQQQLLPQPPLQPPNALIKSKSSLDTNDVMRYKLVRQPLLNTVRDDTAITNYQRYPEQLDVYNNNNNNGNNLNGLSQIQYGFENNNIQPRMSFSSGQYLEPNMQSNLSRSKSVTHLSGDMVNGDSNNNAQVIRNNGQYFGEYRHSLILNQRPSMPVSSASVTRLNYIGRNLNPNLQAQHQQANNMLNRFPVQAQIHADQFKKPMPQQQQHIDDQSPITATQATQATNMQQHSRADASYAVTNQSIDVNSSHLFAQQMQQHQQHQQQQQQRLESSQSHMASRNATLTRHNNLVNGASNLRESSAAKPTSLDDKIKSLLYGKDQISCHNNVIGNVAANNQTNFNSNSSPHAISPLNINGFVDQQQQQFNMMTTSKLNENHNPSRHIPEQVDSSSFNAQSVINNNINDDQFKLHGGLIESNNNNNNGIIKDVYANELKSMGNQQTNHQYHVTVDNNVIQQRQNALNAASSSTIDNGIYGNYWPQNRQAADVNSQLIVDLTTPRVLAKTQTTLLPSQQASGHDDYNQLKNSCSINQVGLPQYNQGQLVTQNLSADHKNSIMIHVDSLPRLDGPLRVNNDDNDPSSERSAPYYYSDLKSDDQRRALMNIVQQKCLSPPPQLLSRSIDQSSTRLASHSNLSSRGSQTRLSQNLDLGQLKVSPLATSESSNSANINKNIDRLFESSKPEGKKEVFQSLLTLASNSSSSTTSAAAALASVNCQTSQHYGSKEHNALDDQHKLKSGGGLIGKSKSLENINPNMDGCTKNPVYENIKRTDKLLNAIRSNKNNNNNDNHGDQSGFKSHNMSEDSIDSILSESIGDSDSSSRFDLLNDVKIPSSEDCAEDISQLIEQLKISHSKLTDEYRSTLSRISGIIIKDKNCMKDEKMSRKVDLLDSKSKKCEQRIQNQLALINMMEKILNQTNKQQLQLPEHKYKQQSDNISEQEQQSQKCHKQDDNKTITTTTTKISVESPKSNSIIMKAIVTEQENPVNFCTANLTTANSGQSTNSANGNSTHANSSISQNTNSNSDDECGQSAISSSHSRSEDKQSFNESGSDLMRDDEDFIEFLTSHVSCQQSQFGASQFDASQFSASDFNTSTSASESSGTGKDSLNSPISTTTTTLAATTSSKNQHNNNNNTKTTPPGILKVVSKDRFESPSSKTLNNDDNGKTDDSERASERKGSLGNVIDVDTCSVNMVQY